MISKHKILFKPIENEDQLKQDFVATIQREVKQNEIEGMGPEETYLALELAPLLAWSARWKADLILPERRPYTDLKDELRRQNLVVAS